jgi:transposase
LHLSFDRLAGIVRAHLGGDPRSEAAFVFHNRRGTHLKILWFDGGGYGGYCILYKRLDRGVYRIPLAIPAGATHVSVSRRELHLLFGGIDRRALRAARRSASVRARR